MKTITTILFALVQSLFFIADAFSEDDIVIGQSASFTGSFSEQAIAYRDGALLYFEEINRTGGIKGRKVKLISLDDHHDNAVAIANTDRFIADESVVALMNYTWTPTVRAVLPAVNKAKIAFLAPYTGVADVYRSSNPTVFTIRASYVAELDMIVRHLATLGMKKIALARYSGTVGDEFRVDLENLAKKYGATIVAEGLTKPDSGDNSASIKKILGIKADAIILGISGSDAVNFVHKFNIETPYKIAYFARSLVGAKQLIKELGKESAGISVTQLVPNPYKQGLPLTKEFRDLFLKKSPLSTPDYISLEGYIAARVMSEALLHTNGRPTRAELVNTLSHLGKVNNGGFELNFRPSNHNGSEFVDLTMIGRDGKIIN